MIMLLIKPPTAPSIVLPGLIFFANLFFLPMAEKISARISFSSTVQSLQVEAVRLIQQKKHPIIVREKLNSFIPPKEWKRDQG